MADKVIVSREKLVAIADVVRVRTQTVSAMTLDEMPARISSLAKVAFYDGEYEVTPTTTAQTLKTAQRFLDKDVEIKEIPYAETSNNAGGETVYIGKEIE